MTGPRTADTAPNTAAPLVKHGNDATVFFIEPSPLQHAATLRIDPAAELCHIGPEGCIGRGLAQKSFDRTTVAAGDRDCAALSAHPRLIAGGLRARAALGG